MKVPALRLGALSALALGLAACSSAPSSTSPTACAPGMVAACGCDGGGSGTQICGPQQAFGACVCGASPAPPSGQDAGQDNRQAVVDAPDGWDGPSGADASDMWSGNDGRPSDGADAASADAASPDACGACIDIPRTLTLPGARHLIADRRRGVLYVTMPGNDPKYPNRVIVIDPTTLTVTASAALGSDPNVMALSDDGSRLWVGIDGAYQIRSVQITADGPVAGASYVLPRPQFGGVSQTVGAMAVLPGSASSVLVGLMQGQYFDGVVVLDEGQPRAGSIPLYSRATTLAVGEAGTAFGFNDQSTGYEFFVFTITGTGLTSSAAFPGLVSGFRNALRYADHRVYAGSGDVVDVTDPTRPTRLGKFPTFGAILPLAGTGKGIMVSGGSPFGVTTVRLLDTMAITETRRVPLPGGASERVWDLGLVGADTLVFLTSGTFPTDEPVRLVVVKTSLLP